MFLTKHTEFTERKQKEQSVGFIRRRRIKPTSFSVASVSSSEPGERVRAIRAFTLLELLVVISIIAILAGMIIPTFYYAKRRAREAKARVAVKQLETAFKAYLDTYKVWPSTIAHDQVYDISDDQFSPPPFKVFSILRGNETPPTGWNPQGIAFFEFENMTNYPTAYQYTALDPWSNPSDSSSFKAYRVMFDEDYDNKVNIGGQDIYRSVVVYSVGEDRNDDSGEGDDVASWK